jgi:hypothetical protein
MNRHLHEQSIAKMKDIDQELIQAKKEIKS